MRVKTYLDKLRVKKRAKEKIANFKINEKKLLKKKLAITSTPKFEGNCSV